MESVYSWVKNIIYYMIFLSVVSNLLADSKYEKYIRFFAGMVLILLVVSPLTGKLRLDEQISSMFRSISLYNDTADLKSQLWEMDGKRLDRIMGKYEEAVEQDVAAMAAADGFACVNARVQIDSDRNSSTYGQVTDIQMQIRRSEGEEKGKEDYMGSRPVNVEANQVDSIMVEPVELGEESQAGDRADGRGDGRRGGREDDGENGSSGGGEAAGGRNQIIHRLTGKVAGYYGIEESHIQIQWKND